MKEAESQGYAKGTIRAHLYTLISRGFRYPDPWMYQKFQNGVFFDRVRDTISLLPHLQPLMAEKALLPKKGEENPEEVAYEDFQIKFLQTFETGTPLPACPPYEGLYRSEPRTGLMLEISEFYRYFGLGLSQREGRRELPDHLCAELEFLHFLTFMEAKAETEGNRKLRKGYLRGQRDFLDRHLRQWIPSFRDKLSRLPGAAFYNRLAMITSSFITCELEWVTSENVQS